ncbi:MAG: ribulose-phosphate 3-epimerase [Elusimicrobia bacterium]|nr:ribulose-phosphate 3-epimerase [Elusimicrobiota bacterium]
MVSSRKTVQIVPSLLAADLSRLGELVGIARGAGVEWVSVDVMDGHFVPNLSFGPDHVRAIKRLGPVYVDAHLMVANPEKAAPWFIKAGADMITFHLEACPDPRPLLREIRAQGAKAGLAVKPATPAQALLEFLGEMDLALVMTVEPGFGGAKFLDSMLSKVELLRRAIDHKGLDCWLQVDGGINLSTISAAARAGADSLVAGSAVFAAADIPEALRALRKEVDREEKKWQ